MNESPSEKTSDSEITRDTFPNLNAVPSVLRGLPAYLKDPENYEKIQSDILKQSLGGCGGHGEVAEWAACAKCQRAFFNRGEFLRKLGFQSPAQYSAWVKVHQTIKERVPSPKYNKP